MAKSYLISRVGEAGTNQLQQSRMQRERKAGVCAPGCEAMKHPESSRSGQALQKEMSNLVLNKRLV